MLDLFERITSESSRMVQKGKGKTLTRKDVEAAVRLVLPGELQKHAAAEGMKAISKYSALH